MASEAYHEPLDSLSPETRDEHRAIVSLMEELDAVDWYGQRIDAVDDDRLRSILAHNRLEEQEHAAMLLEWLRRRDPDIAARLRRYLFTDAPITEIEEDAGASEDAIGQTSLPGALGIGSLLPETASGR